MRRFILIIMCLCVASMSLMAKENRRQVAAKHLFVEAPQEIFPSIDYNTRLDMIDYYESEYNRPSLSVFEDSCIITCSDTTCIEFKASEVLNYQLSMPVYDVIVLISTHSIPMPDSEIAFYDFEWKKLPTDRFFVEPKLADWLTDEGKKVRADVENVVPFIIASYNFDVETGVLTIANRLSEYFDKTTWQKVSKWIRPQLCYKWTGKKFKKQ